MNAPFKQEARRGRLTTALGTETLVLLRMDGSEALSADFEWRIEALSEQVGLDLEPLLGTHATVEIDMAGGTRCFDGIVCEASHGGASENGFRYDLVLRPWLHVAGLRRNQRIFHNSTVLQIVQEVLADYADLGDPHLEVATTEDYPTLEYTVQYGESDADFVRRQLERHGITWAWRHGPGSHAMVLVDDVSALAHVPGGARPYRPVDGHHMGEEEHFRTWTGARRITTGAVRLTEYNFKTPTAAQEVDRLGDAAHPKGNVESFDWPGDYLDQAQGKGVAGRRTLAERGQAPRHRAEGDVAGLGAGVCVTVTGDDVPEVTGRCFVCLSATHTFRSQAYGSGDAQGDDRAYDGSYILIPDDAPLVPERRTPAPRVHGPETAVVVGEGEIDCDEHGRILCRFHWDLDGAHTMRCRVSQNWASKGWGGMVIPRIGMEVIVEHLRGDPDKPIVTGCVYNGANRPPYELPKHKTRSTFKTDTHQGRGFNELRFEDEKGEEEIFVHAEKDRNEKIKNNHTERIDNNWVQSIGHNKRIEVTGSLAEAIAGNVAITVGPSSVSDFVSTVLSKLTNGIGHAGKALGIPGLLNPGVGNYNLVVEKSKSEFVGTASVETIGLAKEVLAGHRVALRAGQIVELDGGKSVEVDADDTIVLSCGKSSIVMDGDGNITFYGTKTRFEMEDKFIVNAGRIDLN